METETAHQTALEELEQMRETMDRMEQERAEMIAEVEQQIERALESMAVDVDESEYGSRPSSRLSSRSAPSTMRRSASRTRLLRSFSTDSTLADSFTGSARDEARHKRASTVPEVEEPEEELATNKKKKRFSGGRNDAAQDAMAAVDEGISLKSDKIAEKVLQIQRKVCSALLVRVHVLTLSSARERSCCRCCSPLCRRPQRQRILRGPLGEVSPQRQQAFE